MAHRSLRFVDRGGVKGGLLSEVFAAFAAVVDHHVAQGVDCYYACNRCLGGNDSSALGSGCA